MLKRLLNECILTIELTATGRLLVKEPPEETKSRSETRSEAFQVAQPVRTRHPDTGADSIYIPGASLKGALRSQAERIARTLNQHQAGACDPFAVLPRDQSRPATDLSCSERITARRHYQRQLQRAGDGAEELSVYQQYSDVCPICRTFGHLGWGRRLRITDFYPVEEPHALEMTHISVDRASGGVSTPYLGSSNYGSGRTFTLQYAYRARLAGKIVLENFALWQLGLLGFLWRDMADGLLPVGHKQTTGTGELHPHLREMRLTRLGASRPTDGQLLGVGALFDEAAKYGYAPEDDVLSWSELHWQRAAGDIRWEATLDQAAAQRLWSSLADKAATVLRDHQWPDDMQPARIARLSTQEVSS